MMFIKLLVYPKSSSSQLSNSYELLIFSTCHRDKNNGAESLSNFTNT